MSVLVHRKHYNYGHNKQIKKSKIVKFKQKKNAQLD